MIYREPISLKNKALWFLLVCGGVVAAYIMIIAVISIYLGFNHLQQDGFWMPILAGVISIVAILWLFVCFTRVLLNQMKERDIINI